MDKTYIYKSFIHKLHELIFYLISYKPKSFFRNLKQGIQELFRKYVLVLTERSQTMLLSFVGFKRPNTSKIQKLLLFVTNIINQSEILFLISINLFVILISMLILLSLEIVKIQNMFINQPDI